MNVNSNTWQTASPDQLMQLGKTAARMAETSGMSMTDAVVRSIGMTKLNSQQIRRVVEAANHEAYNRKFASMDAELRAVEIDGGPADPEAVADRLRAAAAPASAHKYSDYRLPPTQKVAAVSYVAEPVTKTAALHDVMVLREKLSAAHEELVGHVAATGSRVHTAVTKLAGVINAAIHEGAYHEDFERAWGTHPKHAQFLLSSFPLPRAPEGVKVAGRRVTEGHPVITHFAEYVKAAEEYVKAAEAVRAVEEELVRVGAFLKEHA